MIKDKDSFLKELALLPELADNTIAYVFADNPDIDISLKEKFFDNILSYYIRFREAKPQIVINEDENINDLRNWIGKDLRIKSIKMSGVRGLPISEKPFGMDLKDDEGNPQSMIILGENAIGKSSIYDSIEYCYCKKIGEAALRAYKVGEVGNVDYMKFLQHLDTPINNIVTEIETVSDKLTLQGSNIPRSITNIINPDTHFISDYDIYSKGQLDYNSIDPKVTQSSASFHNAIAQSLGFTELILFEKNLKLFIGYKRQVENRNMSTLQKSIENQKILIENNKFAIHDKELTMQNLTKNQNVPQNKNNTIELIAQVDQNKFSEDIFIYDANIILNNFENYTFLYLEFNSKEIKRGNYGEVEFLNLGLELLLQDINCPFCRDSNLKKNEIELSVKERLREMLGYNEILQDLNKAFESLLNTLNYLHSSTSSLLNRINLEISKIKTNVELNELFILENDFVKEGNRIINSDFFIELLRLNENHNYLTNKHKYIYDLIIRNESFIRKDIIIFLERIERFVNNRLSIIRAIKARFINKSQAITDQVRIIFLKKEIDDLSKQIRDANNNIVRDTEIMNKTRDLQNIFFNVKNETIAYTKILHAKLYAEINNIFEPMKQIVQNVLQHYFEIDNRDVSVLIDKLPEEVDLDTGETLSEVFTVNIVSKKNEFASQSPTKYLNTFHYRLFCTIISISIAIASRKRTSINLPIVIDDLFFAGDFGNKATIEKFLGMLFQVFKEYTPSMPLQLIMFTHDQLVFECAIKSSSSVLDNSMSFAKLFPPGESVEENDYRNLIYKFPNYYSQKILKSINS